MTKQTEIRLALFASGNGSNVQNICTYFDDHKSIHPVLICSNSSKAFVLERANKLGIQSITFNRNEFYAQQTILDALKKNDIDYIILAGFMWLVPEYLLQAFPDRILNIHPALLPEFGGKGMYGHFVHEAVSQSGKTESGITIHLVNREYDRGRILFQKKCKISSGENPNTIAEKIHKLEYAYYPQVIENFIKENKNYGV